MPSVMHTMRGICLKSLHNCSSRSRWWHINDGRISPCFLHCFCNVLKNWQAHMFRSSLFGVNSSNHLGAIFNGLLAVECALLSSEALADDLRVLVNENLCGRGVTHL